MITLDGVGPKVADCVALFSLDRRGSIPVDTHVWQIAVRDFDRSLLEAKSLTPQVYKRVGELFRERYGEYAGWAHSLLFTAELPQYMVLLPRGLQNEMRAFASHEKQRKLELKAAKNERKRQLEASTEMQAEQLMAKLASDKQTSSKQKKRKVTGDRKTSKRKGKDPKSQTAPKAPK